MKNLLILLITIIAISSCKTMQKTQAISAIETTEKYISLYRGACYGQCPSYKITIQKDGSFIYFGKMYVDNIGEYKGQLTSEQSQNLFERLNSLSWAEYLENYPVDNVDFPSFKIEYADGKNLKSIKGNSNAPKELIELTTLIDQLIKSLEMESVK